ncbi:GAF domain-containing protein [Chloroflexota bacterium]
MAATVNSALASDNVLRAIVEKVAETLGVKGCSLMLLTPDKKQLLHTVAYGLSDWYVRKGPVSSDRSISAALGGKTVVVANAPEDERIQYREQAKKEGIVSILSAPMMLKNEIIGVIRVYSAQPYNFTPDDSYFVGAIANLGAIALENARLYEAVQKDYDAFRQEMLQWRAELGYEWMMGESVAPAEEKPFPVEPG